jgi:hypothetical protein
VEETDYLAIAVIPWKLRRGRHRWRNEQVFDLGWFNLNGAFFAWKELQSFHADRTTKMPNK